MLIVEPSPWHFHKKTCMKIQIREIMLSLHVAFFCRQCASPGNGALRENLFRELSPFLAPQKRKLSICTVFRLLQRRESANGLRVHFVLFVPSTHIQVILCTFCAINSYLIIIQGTAMHRDQFCRVYGNSENLILALCATFTVLLSLQLGN